MNYNLNWSLILTTNILATKIQTNISVVYIV